MKRFVERVLRDYPRVFFACHRRHVSDPQARRLLSDRQVAILEHLDDRRPIALHQLAAHMGVTVSTMSLSIDRLEDGGYVQRRRNAADARRLDLTLTTEGTRIRDAQTVLEPDCVAALLRALSGPERRKAVEGLALLALAADRLTTERSARQRGGNRFALMGEEK